VLAQTESAVATSVDGISGVTNNIVSRTLVDELNRDAAMISADISAVQALLSKYPGSGPLITLLATLKAELSDVDSTLVTTFAYSSPCNLAMLQPLLRSMVLSSHRRTHSVCRQLTRYPQMRRPHHHSCSRHDDV
jgi:hypothetical protein